MDLWQRDQALVTALAADPQAYRTLTELCDGFGPRFAGSSGYLRATKDLRERLRVYGLEQVHSEVVPHLGWKRGPATLEMIPPRGYTRRWPALALPYCPPGAVEGEVLDLGPAMPETFAAFGERIRGKIVLVSAADAPGYPRGVHRTEKYARAVLAGAAGFVWVGSEPGQVYPTGTLAHGAAGAIAGVSVSAETGAMLRRLLARGDTDAPALRLGVRMQGGGCHPTRSSNVVADLPGGPPQGPLVILCAHLDSHDLAPGAEDNGSGVMAVLEAARGLAAARAGDGLPARVRVVLFGAEEVGLLGSAAYVRDHADELGRVRLVLNADMVGSGGALTCATQEGTGPASPRLAAWLQGALSEVEPGALAHPGLIPYSDHFPFVLCGVPAAMLYASGSPGQRGYAHTNADTVDKVSPERLQASAVTLARLALRAAAVEEWPASHRSPEQVRELLTQAGLEEPLRLDGRWLF